MAFYYQRRHVANIFQTTQRNYYHKLLEENKNDFKTIFSIANELLFRNDSLPPLPTTSVQKLADGFIDFFTEKIDKIMVNLTPTHLNQTDAKYIEKNLLTDRQFNTFRMVTEKDVKVTTTNAPPKHCELNLIQTTLLRQMIDVVAPIITKIVNTSLQSGIFSINLKEALLQPLLKKPGLELIFKNFRPVSNLSYLSKLIELLVCEQIVTHTEETGNLESAYRANHSTETALLRVKTDIMQAIDDQEVVCLVLLDLSAAFDTESHDLLLNHLYHHFGFGETVLQWIRSYLSDRTQRVVIDANEDQPLVACKQVMLKQGVPQGSVLGPILFSLYLSPLGDICHKHNVKFHGYADDLQNYLSFKPGIEMDKECCINNLQNCIAEIRVWIHTNLLKLNDEKTEFIMIGTRQQLARAGNVVIQIGDDMIHPTNAVRNLGVFYDKYMKNTTHVNKVTSTVYIRMKKISKIRHFLDKIPQKF